MKEIFQFLGFDTALLGYQRMNGLAYRLKDYETFEAYLAAQAPKNPVEGMTDKQLIDYYRHLCELQAQELRFLKISRWIAQRREDQ